MARAMGSHLFKGPCLNIETLRHVDVKKKCSCDTGILNIAAVDRQVSATVCTGSRVKRAVVPQVSRNHIRQSNSKTPLFTLLEISLTI